jgi:G:T/U-mismatch repair DNA glycosylase
MATKKKSSSKKSTTKKSAGDNDVSIEATVTGKPFQGANRGTMGALTNALNDVVDKHKDELADALRSKIRDINASDFQVKHKIVKCKPGIGS